MNFIGNFVCKHKKLIIILCLVLVIPAFIGMQKTKINYDILVYLPDDIDTIKGEKILTDEFHMGAFAMAITENMASRDIITFEEKIRQIDGVGQVMSINDLTGTTIPLEFLPIKIKDKIAKDNTSLILITFEDSTSSDRTLEAVSKLREISDKSTKIGGMSAMVLDTKELFNSEMTLYVVIAATLCIAVLMLSLDSFLVPILLILNIGIAILFNMGSNIFLGNICYITKAISAVLQLGVTTDFSIFLYHKYEKAKKENKDINKAMSMAIYDTLVSVFGSSLTTIAGFLALCTMNLKLGYDIGIVMAKGVVFGVLCVITVFPALLLVFDKVIEKTKHREILPRFNIIKKFTVKHYKLIFILFLLFLYPAFQAQRKTSVYYKLDSSIPDNYGYSVATKALKDDYNIVSQNLILVSKDISSAKINMLSKELEQVDGVSLVLSSASLTNYGLSEDVLSDKVRSIYENDKYKMIIINSTYEIATDDLSKQIETIEGIVKKYDDKAIVAGEGPLMKDLVTITDQDFKNVNITSIAVIFVLMLLVLKSISLPIILVLAIEFAIFINMGVPYFTSTQIPFIASVVIGTIQLGATIDYAILMTTKYLEERKKGLEKIEAIKHSLDNSITSIFVSGMCFFAATIGVGIVSKIDMIGTLCTLIARGAIISMLVVMMIVPSLLIIFDRLIIKTTLGFKKGRKNMKKVMIMGILIATSVNIMPAMALIKDETIYSKLDESGNNKYTIVTEHLINDENLDSIMEVTDLNDIENTNGFETFEQKDNTITWQAMGNDIYYKGTTIKKLPIDLEITYKLNGEEKSVNDMLGVAGDIEITLKYTNNEKHNVQISGYNYELYTPFVTILTTVMDAKTTKNLKVTNGKVISNGQNYVVAAVATPGLYESLGFDNLEKMDTVTITYTTTDFELNSLYSVVSAKLLDDIDLSSFDKLDILYDKVDTLNSSSKKLVEGTKFVNDGVKSIREGVINAISSLQNNEESIDNGTLNYIGEKAKEETILSIESQKDAIMNEAINNFNTLEEVTKQIKYASDMGVDSNASLISALKNLAHQMMMQDENGAATYNACASGMSDYCTYVTNAEEQVINSVKESMYQSALELGRKVAAETAYNTALQTANTVSSSVSVATAKNVFVSTKNTIINKVVTSLNSLVGGLDSLLDGTTNLEVGMQKFNNEGISKIANFVNNDLKLNTEKVKVLTKLAQNYNSFTNSNLDDGDTKFILVIDGKQKEKVNESVEEVKEEKKSFFTKIIDLFR